MLALCWLSAVTLSTAAGEEAAPVPLQSSPTSEGTEPSRTAACSQVTRSVLKSPHGNPAAQGLCCSQSTEPHCLGGTEHPLLPGAECSADIFESFKKKRS